MKSYIKFLSRNKLYTVIEAVGLAVSLAFVIVIGTHIWQQYRVVQECPDYDRAYLLGTTDLIGLGNFDKEDILSKIPEIELSAAYIATPFTGKVNLGDEFRTISNQVFIDKDFFEFFPQYDDFIAGSIDNFNSFNEILISESLAESFGGVEQLIGKTLTTMYDDYIIAGVVADRHGEFIPNADVYYSHSLLKDEAFRNQITSSCTFFKIKEGANREDVESKIIPLCEQKYSKETLGGAAIRVYSLSEAYFSDRNYNTVHASKYLLTIYFIAALALLVSSIINYINLSFALTGKRAKEMATRRLVGASAGVIFKKMIYESIVFTVLCFAAALLIAIALEPMMNSLLISNSINLWAYIPLDINPSSGYLLVALAIAVIIGTIAGILPAVHASRYEPIEIVNGLYRRKSKMVFSKVFIVIQNTLSVILIAMVILMESQLAFMMNRPMNSNYRNVFSFRTDETYLGDVRTPLADKFRTLPEVEEIGFSSGFQGKMDSGFQMPSQDGGSIRLSTISCDSTYFNMLGLQVLSDYDAPLVGSIWLSESAAAQIGLCEESIGKISDYLKHELKSELNVAGIYRDIPVYNPLISSDLYNYNSAVIVERISDDRDFPFAIVLKTTSESQEVADAILAAYKEVDKELGIYSIVEEATFVSKIMYQFLEPARKQIRMVELFMFVSMLLSLMGLVAMSTYFSELKSKEIAVRKVFGGTVETETLANVRSYMVMVAVACMIGVPIAVYVSGRYLEQFACRIENYWWIFLVSVAVSFAISLFSVLWQTLKAARTNPATELKKE